MEKQISGEIISLIKGAKKLTSKETSRVYMIPFDNVYLKGKKYLTTWVMLLKEPNQNDEIVEVEIPSFGPEAKLLDGNSEHPVWTTFYFSPNRIRKVVSLLPRVSKKSNNNSGLPTTSHTNYQVNDSDLEMLQDLIKEITDRIKLKA